VSQVSLIVPAKADQCIFIGGCAALVITQVGTTMGLVRTLHRIAGNVVPPDAAEAYAAGYAVGAVRGEQRQHDRRLARRGRGAERARRRRDEFED
jgi:hypothetical protein